MVSPLDVILTVVVLSFWFLFPIGMFLSVSHVDKNTDQIIRLGHLEHDSAPVRRSVRIPVQHSRRPAFRPIFNFRRWLHH